MSRERYDQPLGDLLDDEPLGDAILEPTAGLRERVFATLDPATRFAGFAPRMATFFDLTLERAREILALVARAAEAPWVGEPGSGVRLLHFEGGARHAGADCGLVHIAPGTRFPFHRHVDDEWNFVLQGSAEEEGSGRVWAPGDLVCNPAGTAHAFRALGDEPLVFGAVVRRLEFPAEERG
jgi:quercetin dioxygenase-like cupin family protein